MGDVYEKILFLTTTLVIFSTTAFGAEWVYNAYSNSYVCKNGNNTVRSTNCGKRPPAPSSGSNKIGKILNKKLSINSNSRKKNCDGMVCGPTASLVECECIDRKGAPQISSR